MRGEYREPPERLYGADILLCHDAVRLKDQLRDECGFINGLLCERDEKIKQDTLKRIKLLKSRLFHLNILDTI